ncbi:MAG: terminase small subunit [Bacteroidales bacterium]|nr:terminase small subunit [Bacteroidales bacterium]MBQ8809536.1 terminase small subunit [Bacteroidales bacterium]
MPILKDARQERFCQELAKVGMSQAEAARRAGYMPLHANRQAHRLLQQPHIKARMKELMERNADKAGVLNEELTAFWSNVMKDEAENMKNRLKASELIGKSLGMFVEKRLNENEGTITIEWRGQDEDHDTVPSEKDLE